MLDAGRAVHRRRRARRDAPAVRPRVHEDDARPRATSQQNEPWKRVFNQGQILGGDGERMSKSRGNVAGPGRARRAVRRGHGPAVPDVHGAVGPGRPVEPDRDRWRPQVPEPRLGARPRPARTGSPAIPTRARCRTARTRPPRAPSCAPRRTGRCATSPRTTRRSTSTRWSPSSWSCRTRCIRYRGSVVAGGPEWDEAIRLLLQMLAPAAPHLTEELWSRRAAARGEAWSTIHASRWPEVDLAAVAESTREVPVQVNGKVRDRVTVPANADAAAIERAALASAKVQAILAGRTPDRVDPGRRRPPRERGRPRGVEFQPW